MTYSYREAPVSGKTKPLSTRTILLLVRFHRAGGSFSLVRVVATDGGPAGMVLTHDGKVLIGAVDDRIVFLDTARMISGEREAVLGYFREPQYHGELGEMKVTTPGAVYVNVMTAGYS